MLAARPGCVSPAAAAVSVAAGKDGWMDVCMLCARHAMTMMISGCVCDDDDDDDDDDDADDDNDDDNSLPDIRRRHDCFTEELNATLQLTAGRRRAYQCISSLEATQRLLRF